MTDLTWTSSETRMTSYGMYLPGKSVTQFTVLRRTIADQTSHMTVIHNTKHTFSSRLISTSIHIHAFSYPHMMQIVAWDLTSDNSFCGSKETGFNLSCFIQFPPPGNCRSRRALIQRENKMVMCREYKMLIWNNFQGENIFCCI